VIRRRAREPVLTASSNSVVGYFSPELLVLRETEGRT